MEWDNNNKISNKVVNLNLIGDNVIVEIRIYIIGQKIIK